MRASLNSAALSTNDPAGNACLFSTIPTSDKERLVSDDRDCDQFTCIALDGGMDGTPPQEVFA